MLSWAAHTPLPRHVRSTCTGAAHTACPVDVPGTKDWEGDRRSRNGYGDPKATRCRCMLVPTRLGDPVPDRPQHCLEARRDARPWGQGAEAKLDEMVVEEQPMHGHILERSVSPRLLPVSLTEQLLPRKQRCETITLQRAGIRGDVGNAPQHTARVRYQGVS